MSRLKVRIVKKCLGCEVSVSLPPNEAKIFKYCSLVCFGKSNRKIRITKKCTHCGIEVSIRPSLEKTFRYCSRYCANNSQNKTKGTHVIKKCLHCKKEVVCKYPSTAKIFKYCSRFCFYESRKGIPNKRKDTAIVSKNCLFCSTEVIMPAHKAKNFKYCSRKCARKTKTGKNCPNWKGGPVVKNCHWCGAEIKVIRCNVKEFNYCSRSCRSKNTSKTRALPNYFINTKPEVELQESLTKLRINFQTHKAITGRPDIFIEPNICIFVDGDYWHANPMKYKSVDLILCSNELVPAQQIWDKDKRITDYLTNEGHKVLRFWKHGIYNNLDSVISKIKEAVNFSTL